MSFPVPEILGSAVQLKVREDKLEAVVAYVDEKIKRANAQFVQDDLPKIQLREANERLALVDKEARLKAARDEAAKLKPKAD